MARARGMSSDVPPDVLARSVNYPMPQYNPSRVLVRQCAPLQHQRVTTSRATSPFPDADEPQNSSHLASSGGHLVSHNVPMVTQGTPANQHPAFIQHPLQPIQATTNQLHHCSGCRCSQLGAPNGGILITSQATRPCRPPDYTLLSVVTCVFCNFCLGGAALVLSILSDKDADVGNMKAATLKSKVSLILCVIGVICGAITIVGAICFVAVTYH